MSFGLLISFLPSLTLQQFIPSGTGSLSSLPLGYFIFSEFLSHSLFLCCLLLGSTVLSGDLQHHLLLCSRHLEDYPVLFICPSISSVFMVPLRLLSVFQMPLNLSIFLLCPLVGYSVSSGTLTHSFLYCKALKNNSLIFVDLSDLFFFY